MSKFKKGDKVRRDLESWCGNIKGGEIHTVKELDGCHVRLEKVEGLWLSNKFELVSDENTFDMHKDKWFIRTPTKEVSACVQNWLFSQGFSWVHSNGVLDISDEAIGYTMVHGDNKFTHSTVPDYESKGCQEIVINFKSVVDTVEYPVKIDPKKAEIEELEKVVEDALQKIRNLKGE